MNSYLLDISSTSHIMGSTFLQFARLLTTKTFNLPKFDVLKPLRNWLDNLNVSSPEFAHKVCQLIPSQCPFERDVTFFGRTLLHIPPMCKLNPLYEEVVMLRFKAMCYLADECGEDISQYC